MGRLTQGVRQAQRATWFPLLVFAAVTFAAIPVYRYGHYALTCRGVPLARICTIYSTAGFVNWPIALVLAYVAIAAFYVHRARARGVGTRVRPVRPVVDFNMVDPRFVHSPANMQPSDWGFGPPRALRIVGELPDPDHAAELVHRSSSERALCESTPIDDPMWPP